MTGILSRAWDHLRRWRTWILSVVGAVLISPELVNALLGFDWGTIIPARYMPYVTLAIIVLHVWMRPRPAVLPHDPEVQIAKAREAAEFHGDQI